MLKPTLADLLAFTAVATHRSFRRAAEEIGQSPSALSHTLKGLEARLGVRLLNRTTRSVALTEAGARLLDRLRPVIADLDGALAEVESLRGHPGGLVRINSIEVADLMIVRHVLPRLHARYPNVALDIVTEGRLIDIVAEGFDAGVRLSDTVPRDMVAVSFGAIAGLLAVSSPSYAERMGSPHTPADLQRHSCIRHRQPSGKLRRWEFSKNGKRVVVDPPGNITLNRLELMIEAALGGHGIALVPRAVADPYIASGRLSPVLEDWAISRGTFALYYPPNRQPSAALHAFVEVLRQTDFNA